MHVCVVLFSITAPEQYYATCIAGAKYGGAVGCGKCHAVGANVVFTDTALKDESVHHVICTTKVAC